jgi:hypothetical protein
VAVLLLFLYFGRNILSGLVSSAISELRHFYDAAFASGLGSFVSSALMTFVAGMKSFFKVTSTASRI